MSEFKTFLYSYVLERGMLAYIDQEAYKAARRKASALLKALSASLSETDCALLEDYIAAHQEVDLMETGAIFNAAISLAKELR